MAKIIHVCRGHARNVLLMWFRMLFEVQKTAVLYIFSTFKEKRGLGGTSIDLGDVCSSQTETGFHMDVNLGFEGMAPPMNALLSTLEYLLGPLMSKNGCWGVEGDFRSPMRGIK